MEYSENIIEALIDHMVENSILGCITFQNDKGCNVGHICECGEIHKWPLYVFAHMHVEIMFQCPVCKKSVYILEGNVSF
jgi:hypothetical protein